MSPTLDFDTLLQRHNPVLVLFPEDTESRIRPGAVRLPFGRLWGDYHPCTAELFLDNVEQRDKPKGFNPLEVLRLVWRPSPRTGIDALRDKVKAAVERGAEAKTELWELDVSNIPSQNERRAWSEYGKMLGGRPRECVTYARGVEGEHGIALQYWYLYIYNDFWNNHEADWEMVTIEIDPLGEPRRIGLSSHMGGSCQDWPSVRKQDGRRPIVRVARGSHANYFAYGRHNTADAVRRNASLPGPLSLLNGLVRRLPAFPWLSDFAPADPNDAGERDLPEAHRGVRVEPVLKIMPDPPPPIGSPEWDEWWWLHYRGKWGSWHERIAGTIGVESPWKDAEGSLRWRDPVGWMRAKCI